MTAWIVELVTKATVVLLAAGTLSYLLRRSSAATRHFVWVCGIIVLLAMPAVAFLTPAWSPRWSAGWLPPELLVDGRGATTAGGGGQAEAVLDGGDAAATATAFAGQTLIVLDGRTATAAGARPDAVDRRAPPRTRRSGRVVATPRLGGRSCRHDGVACRRLSAPCPPGAKRPQDHRGALRPHHPGDGGWFGRAPAGETTAGGFEDRAHDMGVPAARAGPSRGGRALVA